MPKQHPPKLLPKSSPKEVEVRQEKQTQFLTKLLQDRK
jgi:hypothetical protein